MNINGISNIRGAVVSQKAREFAANRGADRVQNKEPEQVEPAAAPKRRRIQDELGEQYRANDKRSRKAKAGSPAVEPGATPAPAPLEQAVPVEPAPDTSIRSLAQKYVDQYQKNSGASLSEEQKSAMIEDVSTFYSEPGREGRLEKIVFA